MNSTLLILNFKLMQIISTGYSRSINLMIMLGFFTSTAMQRLFTMQTTIPGTGNMKRVFKNYSLNYSIFPFPGTAKSITLFISSLKSDIPEASETRIQNSATTILDGIMIIDFYSQQGPMIIEQFVRWQLLSWILCFRLVCRPLRKQYPDLFALESAGAIV